MMTGLLALLDDLTIIIDDVAALTKVAAKKTAGLATDDLAVNAEALVGLEPARELPIIWKVFVASMLNKGWLIPLALLLPSAVVHPLLMGGGAYLCFEGLNKILKSITPKSAEDDAHKLKLRAAVVEGPAALAAMERERVKGAIVTDLVLSAEIIAIALSAVADEPTKTKALVLIVIGVLMTVGIYGLVAVLVKLDDIGLHLMREYGPGLRARLGAFIVRTMPHLMKTIGVVGTVAMFLVGGGIILPNLPVLAPFVASAIAALAWPEPMPTILDAIAALAVGLVVGAAVVVVVSLVKRVAAKVRGT
jgi:predicted DNA repair protein MutK